MLDFKWRKSLARLCCGFVLPLTIPQVRPDLAGGERQELGSVSAPEEYLLQSVSDAGSGRQAEGWVQQRLHPTTPLRLSGEQPGHR